MKKITLFIFLGLQLSYAPVFSQASKIIKHENVIYGMISGMALLMDVYQPEHSNQIGIIFIAGSAFGYLQDYQKVYNQVPLKDDFFLDSGFMGKWARELINRGYTIFMINHRFAPRFHYPDIFYDCQRAVRFIRYNAAAFGIDSAHIGAFGQSSGGYLSSMLGVMDTVITNPENPVDRMSSKVQAVVSLAGIYDLSDMNNRADSNMQNNNLIKFVTNYMGELPEVRNNEFALTGIYANASPITHVSRNCAPFLMYYSENDPIVPPRQTPEMFRKLKEVHVPVAMFLDPHSGHSPKPDMNRVDDWFKEYLKQGMN